MLINYIILAHKSPKQLERLVRRLNTTRVFFYIHIDKSVDARPFEIPFSTYKNVVFLQDEAREITPWANIGGIRAILNLLRQCAKNTTSKGYCVLLSGQDYPLKGNDHIQKFFESNYGKNYISIDDVPKIWPKWKIRFERYNFHLPKERTERGIYPLFDFRFFAISNINNVMFMFRNFGSKLTLRTIFKKRRRHPPFLDAKGGSAWWALPIETVNEILDYVSLHPEFQRYHVHTHVPDETFFHSILNIIKPTDDIEETVTYVNWSREGVALPVTFETERDLAELLALPDRYLFARKFDIMTANGILDRLDETNKQISAKS